MPAKDAIRWSLNLSDQIVDSYLKDLDDADLAVRPIEGMNTIAWQLGHLILTERRLIEAVRPGSCPPLPADIEEGHGRQAFSSDDRSKLYSKARYLELWKAQRAATQKVLDEVPESEMGQKREGLPEFAPTVGDALNLCPSHTLMHVGQWVAVRRKLGKPVAI